MVFLCMDYCVFKFFYTGNCFIFLHVSAETSLYRNPVKQQNRIGSRSLDKCKKFFFCEIIPFGLLFGYPLVPTQSIERIFIHHFLFYRSIEHSYQCTLVQMQRVERHILWIVGRFGVLVGVFHEVKQSYNKLLVDFRPQEARPAAMFQIFLYYIDTGAVIVVRCRRIGRIASNSFDMAVKPIRFLCLSVGILQCQDVHNPYWIVFPPKARFRTDMSWLTSLHSARRRLPTRLS